LYSINIFRINENILQLIKKIDGLNNDLSQDLNKTIDFDKIDVFRTKQQTTSITFDLARAFNSFMNMIDTPHIREIYNDVDDKGKPFYWIIYIFHALFQNAFADAITDSKGSITMETMLYIENANTLTTNVLGNSIQNINKR